MNKFQKGDRVVISKSSKHPDNYNEVGEVGTVRDHDSIPQIKFDNGRITVVNQKRLMLLEDWQNGQTKSEETPEGLISVILTDETVLAAVAVAASRILKQDVKIESLTGLQHYRDPGALMPANPDKWEAKLVKQS